MRIAFTTLGCKINQYETDEMRRDLQSHGNVIVPFDEEADVYIINTCSVTSKSDYQSRQVIRSAARRGRGARVIVTGCYAETQPEEIKRLPGVQLVIGNREKGSIREIVKEFSVGAGDESLYGRRPIRTLKTRTRGFLKIQDGCNNHCSYCIVPLARGKSRSIDPDLVTNDFDDFVKKNCPEVVLSGIHIGTYGADLPAKITLSDLIARLVSRRSQTRIRLSSIEPNEITPEIISFLGQGLCRHIHVPLQSGDDSILKTMRRNYSSGFYRDLVNRIHDSVSGVAIGADVMVGFPGEGDHEFQNTVKLIEESPLTHLHVFSYSKRPGTPAADMPGQVPDSVKKKRSEDLRELGMKKNYQFRKKREGKLEKAVIEKSADASTGNVKGITDNYIKMLISGVKKENIGKEITIRVDKVEHDVNFGSVL